MACKKFNLTELQKIRESWQDIPVEAVPESKRKVFSDRKNAVNMYIDGVSVKEIHNATGCDRTHISQLITKCLTLNEHGEYYGYNALIPYMKTKCMKEKAKESGKSFSKLLSEYPTLVDYIAGCWHGNRKYTTETHMNLTTLHQDYFLKELPV